MYGASARILMNSSTMATTRYSVEYIKTPWHAGHTIDLLVLCRSFVMAVTIINIIGQMYYTILQICSIVL